MTQLAVKATIKAFLHSHIRGVQVRDADDIFVMGLVNSLFAMQLVEFTETRFGIEIDADDLQLDNFRTVNALSALIGRKTAGAVAERA
jgi:acyl carrier protein